MPDLSWHKDFRLSFADGAPNNISVNVTAAVNTYSSSPSLALHASENNG